MILLFVDNLVGGWFLIGNFGLFVVILNIGLGVVVVGMLFVFVNLDD